MRPATATPTSIGNEPCPLNLSCSPCFVPLTIPLQVRWRQAPESDAKNLKKAKCAPFDFACVEKYVESTAKDKEAIFEPFEVSLTPTLVALHSKGEGAHADGCCRHAPTRNNFRAGLASPALGVPTATCHHSAYPTTQKHTRTASSVDGCLGLALTVRWCRYGLRWVIFASTNERTLEVYHALPVDTTCSSQYPDMSLVIQQVRGTVSLL